VFHPCAQTVFGDLCILDSEVLTHEVCGHSRSVSGNGEVRGYSLGVCCSALQSVAVCCSVLQCVARCCTVLHGVAVFCSVLQYGMRVDLSEHSRSVSGNVEVCGYSLGVCCSVLQCVAVCCSVLQFVAVWCSVLQCVAVSMWALVTSMGHYICIYTYKCICTYI